MSLNSEHDDAGIGTAGGARASSIAEDEICNFIDQLHGYLVDHHWNGSTIEGPDSGVRWNFKIGRFLKSYLRFIPWSDNHVFVQGQGYWILANWLLNKRSQTRPCRDLAVATSDYLVSSQRPKGYWDYPRLRSRIGKIATVEGNIASIGLLKSYRETAERSYLTAANKWHRFLTDQIGFVGDGEWLAINYWAGDSGPPVPNNSALTLWTLAELAHSTEDEYYLEPCPAMIDFLSRVQLPTGEFPYVASDSESEGRTHFLCFQYNAFQFLDLARYYSLTKDLKAREILVKLAGFLRGGVTESGAVRFNCHQDRPEVPYYTAAVAAALCRATALQLGDFTAEAERAWRRVISLIHPDRGIAFFSNGDYGVLADRRSYPRNLAMILFHIALTLSSQRDAAA